MLAVQLTKRKDGGTVLRCVRADGSVTWQKQDRHAGFFASHDLTHFAVESTLGFRDGFFGLIAQGWDIEDTTGKGQRGRPPAEATEVEHIVGSLDLERACGSATTANDFNAQAAATASSQGRPVPRELTDDDLGRVRSRQGELFAQWHALPAGATLELGFPL